MRETPVSRNNNLMPTRHVHLVAILLVTCLSCASKESAKGQQDSVPPDRPRARNTSPPSQALGIQPVSVTLGLGDTVRLVVLPPTGRGSVRLADVGWSSSNKGIATVSESGLVTAIAPGLAGISVHRDNQVAIARIIVAGSPSTGFPSRTAKSPSSPRTSIPTTDVLPSAAATIAAASSTERNREAGPHEPPGFRKVTSRGFNFRANDQNAVKEAEGWNPRAEWRSGGLSIVEDPSAPVSPPRVAQIKYRKGMVGGIGPVKMAIPLPEKPRSVYASTAVKLSPDFYGHPSGVNKLNFFFMANDAPTAYFSAQGQGNGPLIPQLRLQGTNERPTARNLRPNVSRGARLSRNVWHRLEFLLVANTPGLPNGEAHVWLDGEKIIDYRNINYLEVGETPFTAVSITSIWGGGAKARVPHDMHAWWDHAYVSTR
ncbi:MAG: Ig-like domain-containing protein [Gemmatimonadaceae bacterium]